MLMHWQEQGMPLLVPCPVLLILDAVLEPAQHMDKAFLVVRPILIEGRIMVLGYDAVIQ